MWSVDDWQPADFSLRPLPDRTPPLDPWQPRPVRAPRGRRSNSTGEDGEMGVWLDELRTSEVPRQRPTVAVPVPAALEGLLRSLEFNPQARQRPWQPEFSASARGPSQARRKAASLVALLDIGRAHDHVAALSYLTELFEELPHPATYQALLAQVTAGIDWETLRAMGELKRIWHETPAWWSRRRYCPLHRRVVLTRDRAGAQALSWPLSRRLCEARWSWPVWTMIEEGWFSELLALPFAVHRCWSFVQFLDWRLDRDAEVDCDLTISDESPHGLRPGPLAWQEVAASSVPLADLMPMRSVPKPGELQ